MLIGLHGKKQAGKDTVYQRLVARVGPGTATGAAVERVSFADLLYKSAAEALGLSADALREWKEDERYRLAVTFGEPPRTIHGLSFRQYLQFYGTEAHRQVFGSDFWVENVNLLAHERKVVAVTDVRFPNEAQAVIDAGGTIVHVLGPAEVEHAGDGHASEDSLPARYVDAVLDNSVRGDGFLHLDTQIMELLVRLLEEARR